MTELEQEVIDWHRATFPRAKKETILKKLDEELWELMVAAESSPYEEIAEEMADVAIVAISFLHKIDTSLSEQIKRKLEINKLRKWGDELPNGDRKRDKS